MTRKKTITKILASVLSVVMVFGVLMFVSPTEVQAISVDATDTGFYNLAYGANGDTTFGVGSQIRVINYTRTGKTKSEAVYKYGVMKWEPVDNNYVVWEGISDNIFYGVYPYNAKYDSFTIPTDQSGGVQDADWMTDVFTAGKSVGQVNFIFQHRLAKVTVNITEWNSEFDGTEQITDPKIYSKGIDVTAAYENGGATVTAAGDITEIAPSVDGTSFTAIVAPAAYSASDKFMTFNVDGKEMRILAKTDTLIGGLEPGNHYTFNLTVGKDAVEITEVTVNGWADGGTIDAGTAKECEHNTVNNGTCAECGKQVSVDLGLSVNLANMTETYVINDSETHYFYGSGNYGIRVESGSPTIVLSDAKISLNAGGMLESAVNAIDIVAANSTTTIRVEGTENNITAKYGAGIFVAQGSKVEITSSDRSNVLRVTGKGSSSAIGGYASSFSSNGVNCGDISINKVTLYATSDFNVSVGASSTAIGGSGNASCGTIEVNDATIYAYGMYRSDNTNTPANGLGQTNGGQTNNTIPTIKISDSQIHAYRGGTYADYIGKPQTKVSTSLNLVSDGSAKNSTIYCYTGVNATTVDKILTYDANGIPTEN